MDSDSKAVYLNRAGTLHYRYEICYVVMVVMEDDLQNSDIGALQGMNSEPKFGHNYMDGSGKIINELYSKVSHPFYCIDGVCHC